MTETKFDKLLFIIIGIAIANIFSIIIKLNIIFGVIINAITVVIIIIFILYGYAFKRVLIKQRNPIGKIINLLKTYETIRINPKKEKKYTLKLYKLCRLSKYLQSPYIVVANENQFKFRLNVENVYGRIHFIRTSALQKPYAFQINFSNSGTPYNSEGNYKFGSQKVNENTQLENLRACINILEDIMVKIKNY